jgi:hypothetical protein
MTTCVAILPIGGGGSEVEHHVSSIIDGGSRRRGSVESRWRARAESMRCAHREEASPGAMVASLAGHTEFIRILILKMARRFDGSDHCCSVYTRCSLNVR